MIEGRERREGLLVDSCRGLNVFLSIPFNVMSIRCPIR